MRAGLVLERDAREEHPPALLGQLVIDVLRHQRIARALAVGVRFLVADEYVERLFVLRGRENAVLHLRDLRRLALVLALRHAV